MQLPGVGHCPQVRRPRLLLYLLKQCPTPGVPCMLASEQSQHQPMRALAPWQRKAWLAGAVCKASHPTVPPVASVPCGALCAPCLQDEAPQLVNPLILGFVQQCSASS